MKRIVNLALAALPMIAFAPFAEPAAAQLTIRLGDTHRIPVYVKPVSRPIVIPQRRFDQRLRFVQQRRIWVPGAWEYRRENHQYRRVWVPGYYR